MKKQKLLKTSVSSELQQCIDQYIEAMMMVSSEYGSSLSHEEYMDEVEKCLCKLQRDENGSNIAIC